MVREKLVEITEYNEHYKLICDKCGKTLAEVYYANSQYLFYPKNDCQHYMWIQIGNGCVDNPEINPEICRGTEELLKKAEKIYYDGTTVYLLVQR